MICISLGTFNQAAGLGDKIHVLCGSPRPGGSFSDAHEVFSLSGATP